MRKDIISHNSNLLDAIQALENNPRRMIVVCDSSHNLMGTLTDGDIRRIILNVNKPMAAIFVDDVQIYSTTNFSKVNPETPLQKAVLIMEKLKIWDLPVVDKSGNLVGLLHLHPAIKLLLGV